MKSFETTRRRDKEKRTNKENEDSSAIDRCFHQTKQNKQFKQTILLSRIEEPIWNAETNERFDYSRNAQKNRRISITYLFNSGWTFFSLCGLWNFSLSRCASVHFCARILNSLFNLLKLFFIFDRFMLMFLFLIHHYHWYYLYYRFALEFVQ